MVHQNNRTLKLIRFSGISGIISSTLPLTMILASTVLEESFSWNRNALSDIGVSHLAWLFNSALVIGGLLNLLFALGLRSFIDKIVLLKIGVSLIIMSSISLALVGVFTENYSSIHVLVALGYLLLTPLGLICIGWSETESSNWKSKPCLGNCSFIDYHWSAHNNVCR